MTTEYPEFPDGSVDIGGRKYRTGFLKAEWGEDGADPMEGSGVALSAGQAGRCVEGGQRLLQALVGAGVDGGEGEGLHLEASEIDEQSQGDGPGGDLSLWIHHSRPQRLFSADLSP